MSKKFFDLMNWCNGVCTGANCTTCTGATGAIYLYTIAPVAPVNRGFVVCVSWKSNLHRLHYFHQVQQGSKQGSFTLNLRKNS